MSEDIELPVEDTPVVDKPKKAAKVKAAVVEPTPESPVAETKPVSKLVINGNIATRGKHSLAI